MKTRIAKRVAIILNYFNSFTNIKLGEIKFSDVNQMMLFGEKKDTFVIYAFLIIIEQLIYLNTRFEFLLDHDLKILLKEQ